MFGHLTCYACGDSWCRDLIDLEVQAYIEEHPESAKRIRSGDVTDIDLGEVLCDGCEDYWNDESEAQAQDDPSSFYYQPLDEDDDALPPETIKCPYCGREISELYCQCMEEDEDDELSEDIEDEIDRKADLMAHGRL